MARFAVLESQNLIAMDIGSSLGRNPEYSIRIFSNPDTFLAAAAEEDFDLGIVDVDSSIRLGFLETARKAKKDFGLRSLFIVNIPSVEEVSRIQSASPLGLLGKPFSEREFLAAVSVALSRARMESLLEESEGRYRSLFDASLSPRCILKLEGGKAFITEANRSFRELFNSHGSENGFDFLSFVANPASRSALLARLEARESLRGMELVLLGKDGTALETIASFFPLPGRPDSALVSAELVDMTESRKLQAELVQAQKMESLGRLASGVAHDINNFISAVRGHAEILAAELGEGHQALEEVEGIRKGTDKATALTQQLLSFARKQAYAPRLFDVAERLFELAPLLRRLLGKEAELVLERVDAPLGVEADPGQIEQAIVNLVSNARDATEGKSGGRIRVAARMLQASPWDMPSGKQLAYGEYVRIEVEDNGCGMDRGLARQVFDPFFTTKAEGKGTGLGLALVASIVARCAGAVDFESTPGFGSVFRLWIPSRPLPAKGARLE
ncbi:MAG TPA: ATP-binding protein [Rectinemataceae bacterium]